MDGSFAAILLSAGLSERMGTAKALLRWNSSLSFIEKLINEFEGAGCSEIICVINTEIKSSIDALSIPDKVKFVVNDFPEKGRFYSVRTGLSTLTDAGFCFIHNVDNPFITKDIITQIYACKDHEKWVSPIHQNHSGHPVLIPKKIIRHILEQEYPNTTLRDCLISFPKITVNIHNDAILRNINTPEDYHYQIKS
jgi:CTP:molybdopterin cytidylyltransferase MocA